MKSNVTKETRELFAKQLLITHPNPDLNLYPTDLEWLEYKFPDGSTWPNGLGLCTEVESNTTLASTNQNIFANTINQLSRIQTYNVLAKSRFRPDR